MFPNLAGGATIPVEASHVMPILIAAIVVLSSSDMLNDFSEHAARPRRHTLTVHLLVALALAAALTLVALVAGGAADQASTSLRNLLAGFGLATLAAALIGTRSAWALPVALATPAVTIADPANPSWWHWPTASNTLTTWTAVTLALAVGFTALLLRTAPYGKLRFHRKSHQAKE
ncbi:hypothetical protein [Streptomyces sp. SM12]|uniref:hypothetical protein n=1 Tax=Streptomyces sp. SM12 TaxID=1071602 RepID=UPI0011B097F7|nr:hypothetical protein [Streptomyces sp. SM12]